MRVLFLSSIYPRSYDQTRGVYCHHLCRALAQNHEVRVISPVSWIERLRNRSPHSSELNAHVGRTIYPPYFFTPKMFRSRYGSFMWSSVKGAVQESLREFTP